MIATPVLKRLSSHDFLGSYDAIRGSGLTHYAISQAAEVSPGQIDRFVAGERDLRLGTAARIAEALGLVLAPRR